MEESFETFEDELGRPLRDDQLPHHHPHKPERKPRGTARPDVMTAVRRIREETPVLQPVLKISPREHPLSGVASLRRSLSVQSLVESVERPWAGVTLNRCLMLAVSLLLLSSALQRLHDAVRGRKEVSEELTSQRFALIRREKLPLQQAESSLWSSLLCWINDEDDGRPENPGRASRSLRHRALENPRLLKNRHSSFKQRRARDDEGMREKRGEEVLEKKKAAEERLRDDGRRREKEEDGVKTQRKRKGRVKTASTESFMRAADP